MGGGERRAPAGWNSCRPRASTAKSKRFQGHLAINRHTKSPTWHVRRERRRAAGVLVERLLVGATEGPHPPRALQEAAERVKSSPVRCAEWPWDLLGGINPGCLRRSGPSGPLRASRQAMVHQARARQARIRT